MNRRIGLSVLTVLDVPPPEQVRYLAALGDASSARWKQPAALHAWIDGKMHAAGFEGEKG